MSTHINNQSIRTVEHISAVGGQRELTEAVAVSSGHGVVLQNPANQCCTADGSSHHIFTKIKDPTDSAFAGSSKNMHIIL